MKNFGNHIIKMNFSVVLIISFILLVQSEDTTDAKDAKDKGITIDKGHLDSHMWDLYGMFNDMFTEDEMDLQYFATHDSDKNDKIDGLELFSALHPGHLHEGEHPDLKLERDFEKKTEREVDDILSRFDQDNDGFLDYREFQNVEKIHEIPPSTEKSRDAEI